MHVKKKCTREYLDNAIPLEVYEVVIEEGSEIYIVIFKSRKTGKGFFRIYNQETDKLVAITDPDNNDVIERSILEDIEKIATTNYKLYINLCEGIDRYLASL